MAVQIITVVGTYLDAEGTPATGSVSFTPFLVAAEQDTPSMRTQLPVTTELDADGRFSVDLIASDDPSWYTNDNVPYVVQEDVAGDRGGWMTSLDFATYGPTVDITQLPPLGIVPEYYIPVPGPPNVLTVTGTHTIESGLDADVQISGTSPAQALEFWIPEGHAPQVEIADTITGAPGTDAEVEDINPGSDVALIFTIPRGDKGDKGETGDAATLDVGTTATGAPGTDADVVNSGSTSAAVFDFTIPRGDVGPDTAEALAKIGNLLTDNQAAVETDLTGFTAASATLARVTTTPIQGEASLQITFTSTGSGGVYAGQPSAGYAPATAGAAHTVVASVIGVSGEPYALLINWYTSAGGAISTSTSATFTANGALQSQSFTAVAPANAARATVYLRRTSGDNGSVWKSDKFGLWQGAGGQWAMPGTPITGLGTRITRPNTDDRLVEQWNGTAWSVVDYSSGVRELPLENGWTGFLRIRREGNLVSVRGALTAPPNGSWNANVLTATPQTGWRPDSGPSRSYGNGYQGFTRATASGTGVWYRWSANNPGSLQAAAASGTPDSDWGTFDVSLQFITGDPIPTSLPGVLVTPAPA